MSQQVSVGQADDGSRAQGRDDVVVVLGQRGVGDQQDHQVGRADDVVHLAEGAVGFVEAFRARGGAGGRPRAQAHGDHDGGARQGVTQIQRLCPALGAPADHPDAFDSGERFRKKREQPAPAGQYPLVGAGQVEIDEIEHLRFHVAVVRGVR
jgi:hypothetical protein